jgi:hypothetical protein
LNEFARVMQVDSSFALLNQASNSQQLTCQLKRYSKLIFFQSIVTYTGKEGRLDMTML